MLHMRTVPTILILLYGFTAFAQVFHPPIIVEPVADTRINIDVNPGITVLTCKATGQQDVRYEWFKIRRDRKNWPRFDQVSEFPNLEVKLENESSYLFFKTYDKQTAGDYLCAASYYYKVRTFSAMTRIRLLLVLNERPDCDRVERLVERKENEQIMLPCGVPQQVNPYAEYKWFHPEYKEMDILSNERLYLEYYTGQLHFSHVKTEDTQYYYCGLKVTPKGETWVSEERFRLEVFRVITPDSPYKKSKIIQAYSAKALVNSNAVLQCVYEGYKPEGEDDYIMWYDIQMRVISNINPKFKLSYGRRRLTILNVTEADDGPYWCHIGSKMVQRSLVLLNVTSIPFYKNASLKHPKYQQDAKPAADRKAVLRCPGESMQGENPPTVQWFENGKVLNESLADPKKYKWSDGSSTLTIRGFTDVKCYQCISYNSVGYVMVDGCVGPAGTNANLFIMPPFDETVYAQPSSKVSAPWKAMGTNTFQFYKITIGEPWFTEINAGPKYDIVMSQSDANLELKSITDDDYGDYVCALTNNGVVSFGIVLHVKRAYEKEAIQDVKNGTTKTVYATEFDPSHFTCNMPINDNPDITYIWYRDDKIFDYDNDRIYPEYHTGTLHFTFTKATDAATYSCGLVSKSGGNPLYSNLKYRLKVESLLSIDDTTSNPMIRILEFPYRIFVVLGVKVDMFSDAVLQCIYVGTHFGEGDEEGLIWRNPRGVNITGNETKYDLSFKSRRLTIYNVTAEDAGNYVCSLGKDERSGYLEVEECPDVDKPRVRPAMRQKRRGRSQVFFCRAKSLNGMRTNVPRWFLNGLIITRSFAKGKYKISNRYRTLTILRPKYTQCVQCLLGNSFGYVLENGCYLGKENTKPSLGGEAEKKNLILWTLVAMYASIGIALVLSVGLWMSSEKKPAPNAPGDWSDKPFK